MSISATGETSNPPPLGLLDYSDDEEQTTPQQSQTSQPMSEDLHTAAEQLDSESDAESEPVGSTRKKKNVKEGRSKQSSEAIPEEADATKACKENRGKSIKVSSGESEEEDDSENTDSDEYLLINLTDMHPILKVIDSVLVHSKSGCSCFIMLPLQISLIRLYSLSGSCPSPLSAHPCTYSTVLERIVGVIKLVVE
ncbi:hypothetical protein F2Q68_00034128 [Brassica cretica]|uniref:Uncharacterized protein n=1 Tax=Brassica cretica TaxID=69181 RepID=A0A8S9H8D6_BRACR|nr:hypothetical protein F2Q68_00034128 [Brassica cretica]